jgi:hypothetical protein
MGHTALLLLLEHAGTAVAYSTACAEGSTGSSAAPARAIERPRKQERCCQAVPAMRTRNGASSFEG